MNTQEMTEAFLDALRAFAAEQKREIEAKREAKKEAKKKAKKERLRVPKNVKNALAILAENDGATAEQWRDDMRLKLGLSYHAGRVFWHRYKQRMLEDGLVYQSEDGRFFVSKSVRNGDFSDSGCVA